MTKKAITAEEFFRKKIQEKNPFQKVITLSRELITAEEGMRWAHEYKNLRDEEGVNLVCRCENPSWLRRGLSDILFCNICGNDAPF